MAFGSQTSNATDFIRESLLSILRDVSPNTDNYFVSNLGQAPNATNTLHQWTVYNTARPTTVTATIEGSVPTYGDLTSPTRTTNITEIVAEPVRVSGTMRAVATATGEDAYVFQKTQALKRLKADMEWVTLNGTRASGASGVASAMSGIDGMISTKLILVAICSKLREWKNYIHANFVKQRSNIDRELKMFLTNFVPVSVVL